MASRVVVDESALRLGVVADYGVRTGVKVLVHRALLRHVQDRAFAGDLGPLEGLRSLTSSELDVEYVGEAAAGWRESVLEYCRKEAYHF
jgi:hypothetical protein